MKFQNYCISLIADERIIITSAPESPVSPPSDTQNVKPNELKNNSMIPALFDVDNQNNIIDPDHSDKNASIVSFSSQFISLGEKENDVPFSPATSTSAHAGSMLVLVVGQKMAARVSSDLHLHRRMNDVNAANPAKDTVLNGSDLLSVSPGANHPTGVFNFSLSTTVDNPNENESRQISAGLHAGNQTRVGNKVDSMYDEEHAATPDNGINTHFDAPLSKTESSISIIFNAVCLFRKYFNKDSDNRMLNRALPKSSSFVRPCLTIRGMRRTPIMKTLLQVAILIMTCLPAAMSLAEFECGSCQDIRMDQSVCCDHCNHLIAKNNHDDFNEHNHCDGTRETMITSKYTHFDFSIRKWCMHAMNIPRSNTDYKKIGMRPCNDSGSNENKRIWFIDSDRFLRLSAYPSTCVKYTQKEDSTSERVGLGICNPSDDASMINAVRVMYDSGTSRVSATVDGMGSSNNAFWFEVKHYRNTVTRKAQRHRSEVRLSDKVSTDDPLQLWAFFCLPSDEPTLSPAPSIRRFKVVKTKCYLKYPFRGISQEQVDLRFADMIALFTKAIQDLIPIKADWGVRIVSVGNRDVRRLLSTARALQGAAGPIDFYVELTNTNICESDDGCGDSLSEAKQAHLLVQSDLVETAKNGTLISAILEGAKATGLDNLVFGLTVDKVEIQDPQTEVVDSTSFPSSSPSLSELPSKEPSSLPSASMQPRNTPSKEPSLSPNKYTSRSSSAKPSSQPSVTMIPSDEPSSSPSLSAVPSDEPSSSPSLSAVPSDEPSSSPSLSAVPSDEPSSSPIRQSFIVACLSNSGTCLADSAVAVVADSTDRHSVRCCSNTEKSGWVKYNTGLTCSIWAETPDSPGCNSDKTYLEAKAICEDQGSDSRLCSAGELVCATDTGCGFDTELVWSSTTAQVIDSGTAQVVKVICGKSNNSLCGQNNEVTALKTALYAVRCCSDNDRFPDSWTKTNDSCPWTQSNLFGRNGGYACFSSVTFDTAVAICKADNARLCTADEVNSNCTDGSGCNYNNVLVWTSTVVAG